MFKERYAPRSGIESTNSGLKNRLGLGRLRVRGRGSVFRVILHKVAGWNVLRAAASEKLRAWVAARVAETLERERIWADWAAVLLASGRLVSHRDRCSPLAATLTAVSDDSGGVNEIRDTARAVFCR